MKKSFIIVLGIIILLFILTFVRKNETVSTNSNDLTALTVNGYPKFRVRVEGGVCVYEVKSWFLGGWKKQDVQLYDEEVGACPGFRGVVQQELNSD